MSADPVNLLDFDASRLTAFFAAAGEAPSRARMRANQLLRWLHRELVDDPEAMTNVAKASRALLKEAARVGMPSVMRDSTAADGTCTSCAIYFGEQPSLPLLEMYTKGITFRTGRANAIEAIPHVLELTASGALHPERVTSLTVPWDQAPEALAAGDWTKLVIER